MSRRDGLPEMDRSVDSINVGHRHRVDVGDLDELCESITKLGLLQPITISPDGTLICGARRLAAVRRLGHATVRVWIRSGISERTERMLAEQHENVLRAPLNSTESEALYRELKQIFTEDSARRQRATQFGAKTSETPGRDGGDESSPPNIGKAREQAAELVTGRKSFSRLEHIGELVDLSKDEAAPGYLRRLADDALAAMDADGKVHGHYMIVKAAEAFSKLMQVATNENLAPSRSRKAATEADNLLAAMDGLPAHEVLKLIKQAQRRVNTANPSPKKGRPEPSKRARTPRKRGIHAFLSTWGEMHGWTARYEPAEIGPKLSEQQWSEFDNTVTATVAFSDAVREARTGLSKTL